MATRCSLINLRPVAVKPCSSQAHVCMFFASEQGCGRGASMPPSDRRAGRRPHECFNAIVVVILKMISTWLPVSMELSRAPVCMFQNLMQRSAVPPPEASRLAWKGHQARALTAAWCPNRVRTGSRPPSSQTCSLLSLPPEARCWPLGDHFKPQTSSAWPLSCAVMWSRTLHQLSLTSEAS